MLRSHVTAGQVYCRSTVLVVASGAEDAVATIAVLGADSKTVVAALNAATLSCSNLACKALPTYWTHRTTSFKHQSCVCCVVHPSRYFSAAHVSPFSFSSGARAGDLRLPLSIKNCPRNLPKPSHSATVDESKKNNIDYTIETIIIVEIMIHIIYNKSSDNNLQRK